MPTGAEFSDAEQIEATAVIANDDITFANGDDDGDPVVVEAGDPEE